MAIYLSLKELWRGRGRFLLISMVIALITLLVLFVAGLAEGLGSGNIEYLSKLDADVIVYQENSQLSIGASRIDRSKLGDITRLDGVQAVGPLAFSSATIVLPDGQKPLDVSLIGVEPGKPGAVPVRAGRSFVSRRANEAVIDRNTALRTGLKVGDTVTLKAVQGTKEEFYPLKVVGISDGQQYSLRPSVFVPDLTWDKVRPRSGPLSNDITYNVVAVKLDDPARTQSWCSRFHKIARRSGRLATATRRRRAMLSSRPRWIRSASSR
jgi:putative ABC transport system permease protein